ncbi:MAG TPA: tetratricopeptide repeat protein [Opitutaceae bacterium]
MLTSLSPARFCLLSLVAASVFASPQARAQKDQAPILLSTAGNSWADLGELQKDAKAGKPPALAALGEMMVNGEDVPRDIPGGLDMLARASAAGESNASFRLGKIYEEGKVVPADPQKALEYYRRAALAGVAEAAYNLGAMYVSARGVSRDYKEGLAWIIVATKHGAEADGEQRVRERLTATHRGDIIPAAEVRANELEVEVTRAMHNTAMTGKPAETKPRTDLPSAITGKPEETKK